MIPEDLINVRIVSTQMDLFISKDNDGNYLFSAWRSKDFFASIDNITSKGLTMYFFVLGKRVQLSFTYEKLREYKH